MTEVVALGRKAPLLPPAFRLWLAAFYAAWGTTIVLGGFSALVLSNWPMALAMGFGSYFAGSTPMGGGTVGFPVLVLLFDQTPALGRDFSLAVQSVGMTSASIYILASKQQIAWTVLRPALAAGAVSTIVNLLFVSHLLPGAVVELLFASLWASFGVLMLIKLGSIAGTEGYKGLRPSQDLVAGCFIGLLGGVLVGATGVGIDMLVFVALTIFARASLQVSIPTSVLLMAAMSLVGAATKTVTGTWNPSVLGPWLAAAPIVALGAPFGAIIVTLLNRRYTLIVVSCLCIVQYLWTCIQRQITGVPLVVSLLGVVAFNYLAHRLYERFFPRAERRKDGSDDNPRRWGR